jgi:hypothetical protein
MGTAKTTLYDKIMKWIKNNPILAVFMLIGAFFIAFGPAYSGYKAFRESLSKTNAKHQGGTKSNNQLDRQALVMNKQPIYQNLTINDTDGFLYVRSRASKESEVVSTIYENERFDAFTVEGNWLLIKTKKGDVGYVYSSNVKF